MQDPRGEPNNFPRVDDRFRSVREFESELPAKDNDDFGGVVLMGVEKRLPST